jgi:hypothetical protein
MILDTKKEGQIREEDPLSCPSGKLKRIVRGNQNSIIDQRFGSMPVKEALNK